MTSLAQQIGSKIRAEREAQSLTQPQFAERVGVDYMTVSRWERGVNLPGLEMLGRIAAALRVDIADLLPRNGLSSPDAEMVA